MPMNLGLGLGLSRRAVSGAAPAFTPASIFTGTDEGFWAPVTTSRLWQDVARTTPVTAAGQAVASWELTTRTGVIYAQQGTAGNRPTYEVDAQGFPYIAFNPAGPQFLTTGAINAGSDKMQVFVAYQADGTGSRMLLETGGNSDTVNGAMFFLFANAGSGNTIRFRSKGTTAQEAQSPTPVAAGKLIAVGLGDIAAPSVTLRESGTQVANTTTSQGTGNFGNHGLGIGIRPSGLALPFNGRLYGLSLRFGPNLTAGQITDMEAWLAARINP